MNKLIGVVFLVVGIILLYFGYEAYNAPVDQIVETATGSPTDETMWYLIGGAVAVIIGLFGVIRGK